MLRDHQIGGYYAPDLGRYVLRSHKHGQTYAHRGDIKLAGGQWDGERWTVTPTQMRQLEKRAPNVFVKMHWVQVCCDPSHPVHEMHYVPARDAGLGNTVSIFCGWCDSRTSGQVIAIPGENNE